MFILSTSRVDGAEFNELQSISGIAVFGDSTSPNPLNGTLYVYPPLSPDSSRSDAVTISLFGSGFDNSTLDQVGPLLVATWGDIRLPEGERLVATTGSSEVRPTQNAQRVEPKALECGVEPTSFGAVPIGISFYVVSDVDFGETTRLSGLTIEGGVPTLQEGSDTAFRLPQFARSIPLSWLKGSADTPFAPGAESDAICTDLTLVDEEGEQTTWQGADNIASLTESAGALSPDSSLSFTNLLPIASPVELTFRGIDYSGTDELFMQPRFIVRDASTVTRQTFYLFFAGIVAGIATTVATEMATSQSDVRLLERVAARSITRYQQRNERKTAESANVPERPRTRRSRRQ